MPGKPGMTGNNLGGRRPGAGRPRSRWIANVGDTFIMERQSPHELNPFHPPELVTVLSVSVDEIELQAGEDIITLTPPE